VQESGSLCNLLPTQRTLSLHSSRNLMTHEKTPLLATSNASAASRSPRHRPILGIALVGAVVLLAAALISWRATSSPPVIFASSTERLCGTTRDEAGYIQLANGVDNHYFYWFFEAQHDPETVPLAIWLTGGPGASSFIGLLKENGPCRVVPENLTTETNAYGWNHKANMIWLDQPTNVGFSYGADEDLVTTSTQVGENVYWFLQGFLDKHPEFLGRAVYITGESYAGHYIPAVALSIHQHNQRNVSGRTHINLQGIAIGNGWTDPVLQTQHAIDMIDDNAYNLTLLTREERAQMERDIPACIEAFQTHCLPAPAKNATACSDAEGMCYENIFMSVEIKHSRNRFNFREICPDGIEDIGFCGGIPDVQAFLNQPHVRAYLNVSETRVGEWVPATNNVSALLVIGGDRSTSFAPHVAELLDAGLRVLVYVGDADFVCNWQGNLAWVQALAWRGHDGFLAADETPFLSRDPLQAGANDVHAGSVRAFENLAFLKIFNAGHMVPTHQPAVALDLINRFFANAAFE
jgi:carboxypeptidase C (cathepsin A)